MRSVLSVLLAVFLCALLPISAAADPGFPDAASEPALQLRVEPYNAERACADVLELPGYPDAPFYLFLPADCDRMHLRVTFPYDALTVNGVSLTSGTETDVFREDGTFSVETGDDVFTLQVLTSGDLPAIFISTESGSLESIHADKTYKEPGTLTLAENGRITLDSAELSYVKGRGNTSWRANEKRSYNIKFAKETPLLGMRAAKKWVLTSNNTDAALLRNAIAYRAAQYTSIPYTVDYRFADLYINGNYRGTYMLCEKIEIRENRIDVADLDKANEAANPGLEISRLPRTETEIDGRRVGWYEVPNEPEDVSGGYLLEYEYPEAFEDEPSAFITKNGQCLILHSPEYATKKEIEFVSGLYAAFEEALYAKNGRNAEGKHYTEYIDLDSFVDGVLMHELFENQDMGHTSWYLFVEPETSKIVMGPLWDFDSGMYDAEAGPDCTRFFAEGKYYGIGKETDSSFLSLLCAHRDFLDKMAQRFPTLADAIETQLRDDAAALYESELCSAQLNGVRWGESSFHESEAEQLLSYVSDRSAYLRTVFSDLDAQIAKDSKIIKRNHNASFFPILKIVLPIIGILMIGFAAILFFRKKRK